MPGKYRPPIHGLEIFGHVTASLTLSLLIYKMGIDRPISQACSESWLSLGLRVRNLHCWSGGAPGSPHPNPLPLASQGGPRRAHLHGR